MGLNAPNSIQRAYSAKGILPPWKPPMSLLM